MTITISNIPEFVLENFCFSYRLSLDFIFVFSFFFQYTEVYNDEDHIIIKCSLYNIYVKSKVCISLLKR